MINAAVLTESINSRVVGKPEVIRLFPHRTSSGRNRQEVNADHISSYPIQRSIRF